MTKFEKKNSLLLLKFCLFHLFMCKMQSVLSNIYKIYVTVMSTVSKYIEDNNVMYM